MTSRTPKNIGALVSRDIPRRNIFTMLPAIMSKNNINILLYFGQLIYQPLHQSPRKVKEYLTDQNGRKGQRNSSILLQHREPGSHQRIDARNPERANSTLPSELSFSSSPLLNFKIGFSLGQIIIIQKALTFTCFSFREMHHTTYDIILCYFSAN